MSHTMGNQLTTLKRDARGPARSIAEAVAEFRRRGLSASAFAKMTSISKNTYWNWLHCQGLNRKRGSMPSKSSKHSQVRFVQVAALAARLVQSLA